MPDPTAPLTPEERAELEALAREVANDDNETVGADKLANAVPRLLKQVEELGKSHDVLVERSVLAMSYAEDDPELWEHAMPDCPMLDAVRRMRRRADSEYSLRIKAEAEVTRLTQRIADLEARARLFVEASSIKVDNPSGEPFDELSQIMQALVVDAGCVPLLEKRIADLEAELKKR